MLSYTEEQFENVLDLLDVRKGMAYYTLFNKSPYINSYHGIKHVKNFVWTVWLLYKEQNVTFELAQKLMFTAIFHDFDYKGIDTSTDYDKENIEKAQEAWSMFLWIANTAVFSLDSILNNLNSPSVEELINYTYWPPKKIENKFHRLVLECDHSMPLYENYIELCWNLLTNEMGCRTYKEYIEGSGTYLEDRKYTFEPLKTLWKNTDKFRWFEFLKSHKSYCGQPFESIPQ